MKRRHFFMAAAFFIFCKPLSVSAQEIPANAEQQLENQADADQGETEDDTWLQEMEQFKKHPVNINIADADELRQLRVLTDLQIASLISYRQIFGRLIHIYELQALPSWDIVTIRKILPFVTIRTQEAFSDSPGKWLREGEHSVLIRLSQVLERSSGFDQSAAGTKYAGSPQRLMFRYRYNYKNMLQYGLVGDKDAGEQFFKGAQKKGFDFYSFHLFLRRTGIIRSLALGDFTVNMGQGLIQWQGLAFKKSAEVMGIKRQSAVLRPYSSAGEFYFHRGAGITIRKGKFESVLYGSVRKLSANFISDTINNEDYISSFLSSGYHRTTNEIENRNRLAQTSFGSTVKYQAKRWHAGINGVYYRFSLPVKKRDEPYNQYAISGRNWYNLSIDYSCSYKNIHFFGEAAADRNLKRAFVNGLLISVDPRADISLLHRNISPGYQSVYGNAFTENTYPGNEQGVYAGIAIRPAAGWKIDAYADLYKFSWLKYLVDAPSHGADFLVQVTYTPNRQTEIYTRFRSESKQANQPGNNSITNYLVFLPRQNWRTQVSFKAGPAMTVRSRAEVVWYDKKGQNNENGFLVSADIIYKPLLKPFSGSIRLQYFETGGYNSRIYAYENDVLFSYSVPSFFDKGVRYYLNLNYELTRRLSVWVRMAQTTFKGKRPAGTGSDEITGPRKTEIKVQARWKF